MLRTHQVLELTFAGSPPSDISNLATQWTMFHAPAWFVALLRAPTQNVAAPAATHQNYADGTAFAPSFPMLPFLQRQPAQRGS